MSCVNVLDNDTTLLAPTFGQEFSCAFRASNHNAAANSRIRFNPDGTWIVTRSPLSGPDNTGSWHTGAPANPGDFQIRFTGNIESIILTSGNMSCMTLPSQVFNTPVDSGWLSLATMQEYMVNAFAASDMNCDSQNMVSTFTFSITIRLAANPANQVTDSGSICAEADAMTN